MVDAPHGNGHDAVHNANPDTNETQWSGSAEQRNNSDSSSQNAAEGYGQPYNPEYDRQQSEQGGQHNNPSWESVNPFKLIQENLPQKAKNAVRSAYGIIGIAAVILGIALLVWPGKTFKVFAVAFGTYFVVSGLIRIVSAIVELGLPGGWRILDILIGILLTIGGVVVLKNLALSGRTLAIVATMTVGIGWIAEGIMALAESWQLPSSGWSVFYGIISIIAGMVILFSPISSMIWLIVFGGGALIVMGISSIIRAFTFGKTKTVNK